MQLNKSGNKFPKMTFGLTSFSVFFSDVFFIVFVLRAASLSEWGLCVLTDSCCQASTGRRKQRKYVSSVTKTHNVKGKHLLHRPTLCAVI